MGAEAISHAVKCHGQLCVQPLDGSQGVDISADELGVSASVVEVPIALEVEIAIVEGRLDPRERVTLKAADRSPGPVGFSLYQDDADISIRDLVVAMLTISDNPATDALLRTVGVDAVNECLLRLGLTRPQARWTPRSTARSAPPPRRPTARCASPAAAAAAG